MSWLSNWFAGGDEVEQMVGDLKERDVRKRRRAAQQIRRYARRGRTQRRKLSIHLSTMEGYYDDGSELLDYLLLQMLCDLYRYDEFTENHHFVEQFQDTGHWDSGVLEAAESGSGESLDASTSVDVQPEVDSGFFDQSSSGGGSSPSSYEPPPTSYEPPASDHSSGDWGGGGGGGDYGGGGGGFDD